MHHLSRPFTSVAVSLPLSSGVPLQEEGVDGSQRLAGWAVGTGLTSCEGLRWDAQRRQDTVWGHSRSDLLLLSLHVLLLHHFFTTSFCLLQLSLYLSSLETSCSSCTSPAVHVGIQRPLVQLFTRVSSSSTMTSIISTVLVHFKLKLSFVPPTAWKCPQHVHLIISKHELKQCGYFSGFLTSTVSILTDSAIK